MTDFFNNFHFLRPYFLIFLIIPFLLYRKNINFRNGLSPWRQVCDKKLLDYLLVKEKKAQKIPLNLFMYLALIWATIAGAGPCWKKIETQSFVAENPVMFVLSLAKDMDLKDITPTRLDRAKFAIIDIANEVQSGQFGIEVYSSEPYVISPITDDTNLIKALMSQITNDIVPDRGDRLDRAIDMAVNKFKDSGFLSGNIVLLTSDVGQRLDLALEEVEKAKRAGFEINVVDTSFLGNDKLQIIAQKGNGIYVKIRDADISVLEKKLSDIGSKDIVLSKNLKDRFVDFGYYLIFIPLLCMLPFFRKGLIVFVLVLFSFNAEAGFLLNKNQEGLMLYNQNKLEEALEKFSDPFWKSIVLYKQNKIDEAFKLIEKNTDEHSLYNKGVFLVKMCKYEEAKKTFEDVVKLYPENKQAKNNLDLLNKLFIEAKNNPSVLECNSSSNKNSSKSQNKDNNENKNENKNKNSSNDDNSKENDNKNNDENSLNNNEQKDNQDNNKNNNEKNNDKKSEKQRNEDNYDTNEQNKNNNKNDNNLNNDKKQNAKKDNSSNKDNENKNENENENKNEKENNNQTKNQDLNNKKKNEQSKQEESSDNDKNSEENRNSESSDDNNSSNKKENESDANQQQSSSANDKENKQQDNNKPNEDKDNNRDADNKKTDLSPNEGDNNKNSKNNNHAESLEAKDGDSKNRGNIGANGNALNGDFNEEDLAVQRQYREIPEDVGGLLREFIKKEYAKDRYRDEIY